MHQQACCCTNHANTAGINLLEHAVAALLVMPAGNCCAEVCCCESSATPMWSILQRHGGLTTHLIAFLDVDGCLECV